MAVLKGCWFILLLTLCAWISCSDGLERCWSCDGEWKACTHKAELEKLGPDKTMMCNAKKDKEHACYTYVPNSGGDKFSRGCFHIPKDDKYWKPEGTFIVKAGKGKFSADGQVQTCNNIDKCNNQNWENITEGERKPEGTTIPPGHPSPEDEGAGSMSIQPGHLVTFLATFTVWLLIKNLN